MAALLAILELGIPPDFIRQCEQAGYQVQAATTMRKAMTLLKTLRPAVIIAQFIFDPRSAGFISNVDTLFAVIASRLSDTRLVLLIQPEDAAHLQQLRDRYGASVAVDALYLPFDPPQLAKALA